MKKSTLKRISILIALIIIIVLFYAFNVDEYADLEYIQEKHLQLQDYYTTHPIVVPVVYIFTYIFITTFSFPGAVILTIAGGALFGFIMGTIYVSIASTVGATLACFMSRYLLRDWIENKFGSKLDIIQDGIRRDGSYYLFTLRLVPIFPFFVINAVFGLTRMSLAQFAFVSWIGMLPGTMVYVNAGRALADIDSIAAILSPQVIISFIMLGIFPFVVKGLLKWVHKKKNESKRLS